MYSIKYVSQKTGLSTHVIRVWERRYGLINPDRTESNRRLYTDKDVQKLILLKQATQMGHNIGQLAGLSYETLEAFADEYRQALRTTLKQSPAKPGESPEFYISAALEAARGFDSSTLEDVLDEASISFSQPDLVEKIIIPFLHQVGDRWFSGDIRVAQEHSASETIRTFLGRLLKATNVPANAPVLVTATVTGLLHEFGALLASISAASLGWRAEYLGVNLPVEEIVFAVREMNARAAAISVVYLPADEGVIEQLVRLARLLPPQVRLFVGGSAAKSYKGSMEETGAVFISDLAEFGQKLLDLN